MARVPLLRITAIDLGKDVRSGDLSMFGCLGCLLLLLPVYHITNRINVRMRLELERVRDPYVSPRAEYVRAQRVDEARCGAATIRADLYR